MGGNTWMHKPSLLALKNESRDFYIGNVMTEGCYPLLSEQKQKKIKNKFVF